MISGSHPGRRSGVDRFRARTDGPLVARSSAAGRSVDAIFATRNAPRVVPTTGTGSVRAAAVAEVRPSGDLQGAPERRLSDLRSSPRGYQAPEPGGAWLPLSESSHPPRPFRPLDRCPFAREARAAAWGCHASSSTQGQPRGRPARALERCVGGSGRLAVSRSCNRGERPGRLGPIVSSDNYRVRGVVGRARAPAASETITLRRCGRGFAVPLAPGACRHREQRCVALV